MSTPKTAKMPIAITHFSDLDLSCQHLTTGNFMEFNVAYQRELVPRQSINIDMTTFIRMAPLPVPTYGNCDIHNRAYFVPYRTVMRGWNEFIDDTRVVNYNGDVIYPNMPCISNINLIKLFTGGYGYSRELGLLSSVTEAYDFVYYNADGEAYAYVFSVIGKYTYKLLCSLGIKMHFDIRSDIFYSALPLLSLMRVYSDWYFPSAYVDDEQMNDLRKWFEKDPTDDPTEFASEFDASSMSLVFYRIFRVAYDSDYFVSAWDNPVSPTNGAFSLIELQDVTNDGTALESTSVTTESDNGTPIFGGSAISQFAIDALKSVSDYMRRHQIAGARVLDRYLSRWGIQLPSAKLNRSEWIGESTSKFVFGDVFSTADTDGANLGSYAGRGAGRNEKKDIVSYTSSEFGMLIIISSIVPKSAYFQGCDRTVLHLNRLDFYTPEFDNLGVQALATSELFVPIRDLNPADASNSIDYNNSVFGFVPRYSEYKRGYDNMTGDFILGTQEASNRGWSLMRDVSDFYYSSDLTRYENVVHSLDFVDSKEDWQQYNRIFNVTSPIEDKFKIIHNFVVKSRFPGKPMYDSYEFREEDKAQKVTIDVNGVRAN